MGNRERIAAALGQEGPDFILTGCTVANVLTGEFYPADVAVKEGRVAAIEQGLTTGATCPIKEMSGVLLPGLINAHCHVESSMAYPYSYALEELRHGVTTLITDPHEIANVAGLDGIAYMLDATQTLPSRYYVMLPSCVPATQFEHSGAILTGEDLATLANHPRVLGLGELMNYPGLLAGEEAVLEKLERFCGRIVDGHYPGGTGRALAAYAGAGVSTDHEATDWPEALEKLRAGMAVFIREGSASKNLTAILTGLLAHGPLDTRKLGFCTDDKHLADIQRDGTILHCLRQAVALGMAPMTAIQMATINPATVYRLWDEGAIAPGRRADWVLVDNLTDFVVQTVFVGGEQVVTREDGATLPSLLLPEKEALPPTMRVGESVHLPSLNKEQFTLPRREIYSVIGLLPGEIVTRHLHMTHSQVEAGLLDGSLCKVAVVERHRASGQIGLGLLSGYGLRRGAVATTVAHDSHNLIVVGSDEGEMLAAAEEIRRMEGGYTLVQDGTVVGRLPLPLAGLMSTEPTDRLLPALEALLEKGREMGIPKGIDPFITLSFIALPVIPALRITDMGLFDSEAFALLP